MLSKEQRERILRLCLVAKAALRRDEVARVQDKLHAITARRIQAKIKRYLDDLWRQVNKHVREHGITAELADEAIDWDRWKIGLAFEIKGELKELFNSLGEQIGIKMETGAVWDLAQSPAVIDWIDRHVAEKVVQVAEDTRLAIRAAVRNNYLNWIGTDRRTMAREIRPLVGLTEYQQRIVQNYRERLEQAGITGDRLTRMVTKKAEAIRTMRAKLIAETECHNAADKGALATYRGNSQVQMVQRYVTSDSPCEECIAADGKLYTLDEADASEWHPNCGCRWLPVTAETEIDEDFWAERHERFMANLKKHRHDDLAAAS